MAGIESRNGNIPVSSTATGTKTVADINALIASMSVGRSAKATTSTGPGKTAQVQKSFESANGKISKVGMKKTYPARAEPLLNFPLFNELPFELRATIWEFVSLHPHLLELERGDSSQQVGSVHRGSHAVFQVSRESRRSPAMLLVSREARTEGLRYYERVDLGDEYGSIQNEVYFNRICDIVYFGQQTCVATVDLLARRRLEIRNLAIFCSRGMEMCCGGDILKSLHGEEENMAEGDGALIPGYHGLRDISWIVQSNLWPVADGKITAGVGLRPASSTGLTKGQIRFRERLENQIDSVQRETGLDNVGVNKWTGEDMPSFRFSSFAPLASGQAVFDGLSVTRGDISRLRRHGWKLVKDLENKASCSITVHKQSRIWEMHSEVGFEGPKDKVGEAKAAIQNLLA